MHDVTWIHGMLKLRQCSICTLNVSPPTERPTTSATPPPLTHSTFSAVCCSPVHSASLPRTPHSSSCPPPHPPICSELRPAAIQACSRSDRLIHRCFTPSLLQPLRPPPFSQAPGCSSCTINWGKHLLLKSFFKIYC